MARHKGNEASVKVEGVRQRPWGSTTMTTTVRFVLALGVGFAATWLAQAGGSSASAAGITTAGLVIESRVSEDGSEAYLLDQGASTLEVIDTSDGSTITSISMPSGVGTVKDMDYNPVLGTVLVSTATGYVVDVDLSGSSASTLVTGTGLNNFNQVVIDTLIGGVVGSAIDLNTMNLMSISSGGALTLLGSAPYTVPGDMMETNDATTSATMPELATFGKGSVWAWFYDRNTATTRDAQYTGAYEPAGAAFDGTDDFYVGARHTASGADLLLRLDATPGGWGWYGTPLHTYSGGDLIQDVSMADHFLTVLLKEASTNKSKLHLWDIADGVTPLSMGYVTVDSATPSGALATWSEGGGSALEIYGVFATTTSGGIGEVLWDPGNTWDFAGGAAITGSGFADKTGAGGWPHLQGPAVCVPCEEDHGLSGGVDVPPDIMLSAAPQATPGSVEYVTGEEVYVRPLFSIPGIGLDLDVRLTYRSRSDHDYRYGRGWFLNHDMRMRTETNGDETVQSGHGRQDTYPLVGGNYLPPMQHDTTLTVTSGVGRTIVDRFGTAHTFSKYGYCTSVKDRYNNTISYTWSSDQLTGITDTRGNSYSLSYDGNGRLSSLTDFGSRVWTFTYDYLGQLIAITTPATTDFPSGRTHRYAYTGNHSSTPRRSNLRQVISPKGDIVQTLVYDHNDQVVEERLGPGTYTMSYNAGTGKVTVDDRSGNTTEYVFDTYGMLTSTEVFTKGLRSGEPTSYTTTYINGTNRLTEAIVYPRGNRVDLQYDSSLNLTEVRRKLSNTSGTSGTDIVTSYEYLGAYAQRTKLTDPNGNVTTYTVDGSGNTTTITRPTVTSPASQSITESFTFDSTGRLTSATDGEGRVTDFVYYTTGSSTGWLKEVVRDPGTLALTTEIQYDTWGHVVSVTDPRGHATTFDVDDEGYVTEVQAPSPVSTLSRFSYDANRSLTVSEFENRNKDGTLDSTTPWITTTYTLNEMGWRTEVEQPLTSSTNATTTYTYTDAGLVETITNAEGEVTKIEYDERDLVFKVTRGYGTAEASTVRIDYDDNGNRVKVIDGRGNDATWTLDMFDRVTRATDRLGHYTDFTHDKNGNVLTVKAYSLSAALVAETEHFFDEIDRLWKVKQHRFGTGLSSTYPTTTITRDKSGRVTAVSDPSSAVTSRTYDAVGRLKTVVDAVGNKTETFYDANGNVTKVETTDIPDAGGSEVYTTQYGYDVLNRRTSMQEIDRLNTSNVLATSFAYDSRGNLTFRVDAEGHPVRWTYDLAGRMVQYERALSTGTGIEDFTTAITEAFAYDDVHRLTSVTDDNFHATTYLYDALGRSTKTTYADTKYVTRSFDQNGNVASWTDQNGSVVTNLYDEENRLYQRSISKGSGVGGVTLETFGHDALGRVLTAINNDAKVILDWDSVGNLLSDQQGYNISGSEQYKTPSATWSIAGAMSGLSYPGGLSISHARDAIHRLTAITDVGTSGTILDVDWQGLGRKAKATNENGTVTEYAYDGFRRLAEIDHRLSSSGGSFHTLEYAYDDVHNRRMEKHSFDATWVSGLPSAVQSFLNARDTKGDVYGYDWAYRMVTAKYDVTNPASEVATPNSQTYVTQTGYTLDGLGNRSQVGVTPYGGSTSTTTYASDVVNQYTSIASVSRTHDDNGNLTDDGNQEYVYDYANHLIEVKDGSSATVATYMYDALGRRVEKDVAGGAVTRYILWGVSIIEEVNGSGTWQASYVQTDRIDFPCAMDRADVADVDGDTNTSEIFRFHFHQQALGSVTEVSEPGGAIVEWVAYDVYGAATVRDQGGTVVGSSAVGNPFLFTGREYDAEIGLYHYRARAYDPEAGRFLQRDPLGYVDGLGLYQYASASPARLFDPLGTDDAERGFWHDVLDAVAPGAGSAAQSAGVSSDELGAAAAGVATGLNETAGHDPTVGLAGDLAEKAADAAGLGDAFRAGQDAGETAGLVAAVVQAGYGLFKLIKNWHRIVNGFRKFWCWVKRGRGGARPGAQGGLPDPAPLPPPPKPPVPGSGPAKGKAAQEILGGQGGPSAGGQTAAEAARGGLSSLGRAGPGHGVREVVGDAGDARRLFDQLRGSNPVTEVKPGVFTAPGANGGTATFRATSKSGPPTVDVHGIEEGIRKIKFVEK